MFSVVHDRADPEWNSRCGGRADDVIEEEYGEERVEGDSNADMGGGGTQGRGETRGHQQGRGEEGVQPRRPQEDTDHIRSSCRQ